MAPLASMTNILSDAKTQQVIALGRLGWTLRRIEQVTGVRRETASAYLKAAGLAVRPPGRWGHPPANPAKGVSTDSDLALAPCPSPKPRPSSLGSIRDQSIRGKVPSPVGGRRPHPQSVGKAVGFARSDRFARHADNGDRRTGVAGPTPPGGHNDDAGHRLRESARSCRSREARLA